MTTQDDLPYHLSRSSHLISARCAYEHYLGNLWGRGQRFAQNEHGHWHPVSPSDERYAQLPIHPGGVQRRTAYRHLSIGATMHAGLECILRHAQNNSGALPAWDEVYAAAMKEWNSWYQRGWEGEGVPEGAWPDLTADYLLQANALLWLTYHRLAPALLAQYDVVLVEEEETVDIGDNMFFHGRADAVLRPKLNEFLGMSPTSGLVVLSAKSIWQVTSSTLAGYYIDAQGYTEPWILEHWLRKNHPHLAAEPVAGIQFLLAVKGITKRHPQFDYKYNVSPLTHIWTSDGEPTAPRRRSKKSAPTSVDEVLDALPDGEAGTPASSVEWHPAYRYQLPDGTWKNLSTKYKQVRASEFPGGQFAWLAHLNATNPQVIDGRMMGLGETVGGYWRLPPVVPRNTEARDRYIRAMAAHHTAIRARLRARMLGSIPGSQADPTLMRPLDPIAETYLFPRAAVPESTCIRWGGVKCGFYQICHTGNGKEPLYGILSLQHPDGSQVYAPRDPHHPESMSDEEGEE